MDYLFRTIKTKDFWNTVMGGRFPFGAYVDSSFVA